MSRKNIQVTEANDADLAALIKGICAGVQAAYVFCYTEIFAEKVLNELLIVVPNKQVRILNDLVPVLNIVFSNQQKFSYRLFHVHEVKQALQNGSLFFDQLCKPQNCLFNRSTDLFNHGNIDGNLLVQQVKSIYTTELNKANDFLAGAKFYLKRQNLPHCAFMLHQFFDLSYRAIELLVMGAEKKTHRIQAHQNYIKPYVPRLATLFKPGNEADIYLLYLLDEAYLAVRYENNYQITEAEIKALFEKAELLAHYAHRVYQQVLNNYFDREVNSLH